MTRWFARVGCIALVVFAAACGHSTQDPKGAATPAHSPAGAAPGRAAPSATVAVGDAGAVAAPSTGGAVAGPSSRGAAVTGAQVATNDPSAGPGAPAARKSDAEPAPLPIRATLASACVRPGTTQTITIKSLPGSVVAYGATYSDGNSGMSGKSFYGGNKGTYVGPSGSWTDTWVVSAKAPPGKVRVDVSGAAENGSTNMIATSFTVAGVTGKCA